MVNTSYCFFMAHNHSIIWTFRSKTLITLFGQNLRFFFPNIITLKGPIPYSNEMYFNSPLNYAAKKKFKKVIIRLFLLVKNKQWSWRFRFVVDTTVICAVTATSTMTVLRVLQSSTFRRATNYPSWYHIQEYFTRAVIFRRCLICLS